MRILHSIFVKKKRLSGKIFREELVKLSIIYC